MKTAPIPGDEPARLQGLQALHLLDTEPEERFDRITRLAARMFDVPFAMVNLVDGQRQWFKSCVGLPQGGSTLREASFCAHAILKNAPTVVPDTCLDPRFAEHPMVMGEPGIRFYAAAPLRLRPGSALGTLCILDRWPRALAAVDVGILRDLADLVVREMHVAEATITVDAAGLMNRQTFLSAGQKALQICQRGGSSAVLCTFSLQGATNNVEWDDFAVQLKPAFRGSDLVARLGSGTFAVLATRCNTADLQVALERLHRTTTHLRPWRQQVFALDPEVPVPLEDLLAMAESALATHDGRSPTPIC